MRYIFSLLFILRSFDATSQEKKTYPIFNKEEVVSNNDFSKNNLYIFGRGTLSKSKLIGKKFNLLDTNLTHVGIGLIENRTVKIFNVSTEKIRENTTSLRVDDFRSFIQDSDVFYLKIWKVKVSKHELRKAKMFLQKALNKKIIFDFKFKVSTDDSLYCSEFCAQLLNFTSNRKFNFPPTSIEIKEPLIESLLGRKTLSYYPVDFFNTCRFIKPISTNFIIWK